MKEPETALLILDKPLVDHKLEMRLPEGVYLNEIVKTLKIKPGLSFVLLVNGQVSDGNYYVKHGDIINCIPQIVGGLY
ncbi:MAG: hypothetical protein CL609_02655 [Anaerolineaceae bacterium]|nr:hypothetical protein [Anaerolineaceae bacterium]